MLVVQMLLPRFLVLEVLLFFHFLQQSHAAWSQEYYFVGQTRGGPSNGTLTHSDHSLGGPLGQLYQGEPETKNEDVIIKTDRLTRSTVTIAVKSIDNVDSTAGYAENPSFTSNEYDELSQGCGGDIKGETNEDCSLKQVPSSVPAHSPSKPIYRDLQQNINHPRVFQKIGSQVSAPKSILNSPSNPTNDEGLDQQLLTEPVVLIQQGHSWNRPEPSSPVSSSQL